MHFCTSLLHISVVTISWTHNFKHVKLNDTKNRLVTYPEFFGISLSMGDLHLSYWVVLHFLSYGH